MQSRATFSGALVLSLAIVSPARAQDDPPEDDSEEIPADAPIEAEEYRPDDAAESRPPKAGKGAITGVVIDRKFKEPAIEGQVSVVGTQVSTFTDVDGAFRLELWPGAYQLRFYYEFHKPERVLGVVVTAGKITRLDVELEPDDAAESDVIEVVTQVDTSSLEGQLVDRKRAAAAGDSIGRAEITKANDRTAADAVRRVVGATLEGSRFLYVRGLGERYTNALLDGLPLPSPEPDRQAVPLDLFPSQILDSLTIVKTFTPDVPGDFAGGSVRIDTRRIPNELTLAGGVSVGLNTATSFQPMLAYEGGGTDWLGFDDGTRDPPDGLPDHQIGRGIEKPDGSFSTAEERAAQSRLIDTPMSARSRVAPPNHGGNVVASNSWELGAQGRLGVLGSLTYDRRFERRTGEVVKDYRISTQAPGELLLLNDYQVQRGTEKVSLGALLGVTVEVDDHHRWTLTGIHTQADDDEAAIFSGHNEERGLRIHNTRLKFVARGLTFGQLRGEHTFEEAGGLELGYAFGLARATRDEPDTRGTVLKLDTELGYVYENDSYSGIHLYTAQTETTYAGQLDFKLPLRGLAEAGRANTNEQPIDVKWGGAVTVREREFHARRLRLAPVPDAAVQDQYCGGRDPQKCPDELYGDSKVGRVFAIDEAANEGDVYTADLSVVAAYAMLDAALAPGLRVVGGPRLEASHQSLVGETPYFPDKRTETELAAPLVLPALGLVYSPVAQANLRAAASRTVARPQVRELAPFTYTDYFGGREIKGNPDLVQTKILNADLRFEYFPTSREVLAVSSFFKRFEDPIEQTIDPTSGGGRISYINAPSGDLFGVELEARKSLDFIADALAPFSVISNLTFARSRIAIEPGDAPALTSRTRPLSLQAPYVVNLALDFDLPETATRARVLYNVVGPRLAVVGTRGIPDIYEQERHQLDVTVSQRLDDHVELKASATNLIDSPYRQAHDTDGEQEFVVREHRLGQTFSLGLGLTY